MFFEPRYRTLVDIFDHSVKAYANRPLFGTKEDGRWRWTSYEEFARQVARCRAGLASLGIERGDRVAVVSDNRVEWAVVAYACYGLGAAVVPMYEAQEADEQAFILRDCGAKAVFVAGAAAKQGPTALAGLPSIRHAILIEGQPPFGSAPAHFSTYAALLRMAPAAPAVRPDPGDVASIIYTSGTTGKPKGVVLTHGNLASNVSAMHEVVPAEDRDRSLSFLPWAHVFGQTAELHGLFSGGASIAICPDVGAILEDLRDVRPTVLFSVPRVFNKLYTAVQEQLAERPAMIRRLVERALESTGKERSGTRLTIRELATLRLADRLVFSRVRARFGGRLRYAVSGGAALSADVAAFIDSLGILVYEGYGLTETSPIATANVPGSRKIGSVGRPVPGVRVEIDAATAERKAAESGKPARFEGEVLVYGPNVMQGYLDRPEETAAVLTPEGGLRTGDMGYLDAHGFLFITGRIKEQYKLENGKYVVPTPLEEQLKLSPFVANALVHGANRPFNVAIVVANVPAVRAWAQRSAVALPRDTEALLKHRDIRALFEREIRRCGTAFKGYEAIRDFALVADDFTTDNGMLTPSLKLKRRKVAEVHGLLLDGMYPR